MIVAAHRGAKSNWASLTRKCDAFRWDLCDIFVKFLPISSCSRTYSNGAFFSQMHYACCNICHKYSLDHLQYISALLIYRTVFCFDLYVRMLHIASWRVNIYSCEGCLGENFAYSRKHPSSFLRAIGARRLMRSTDICMGELRNHLVSKQTEWKCVGCVISYDTTPESYFSAR